MEYPIEMKEAVIKKVLVSGKPRHEIAREAGIGRPILTHWMKHYKLDGNTTKKNDLRTGLLKNDGAIFFISYEPLI